MYELSEGCAFHPRASATPKFISIFMSVSSAFISNGKALLASAMLFISNTIFGIDAQVWGSRRNIKENVIFLLPCDHLLIFVINF